MRIIIASYPAPARIRVFLHAPLARDAELRRDVLPCPCMPPVLTAGVSGL